MLTPATQPPVVPYVFVADEFRQGVAKASHEAEQMTLPLGVDDPTNGFYSSTVYAKGAIADMAWQDGVREIILGRTPMTQYDQLIKDWQAAAGEQVRKEYTDALAQK